MIVFAQNNFKSFHLFLPDEPTIHTLEALGYGQEEAKKKMKKQINWLRNKIQKALESKGLKFNHHLLDFETLNKNHIFRKELDTAYQLFDRDEEFRAQCLKSSRWVLKNKMDEEQVTEQCLLKAVKYFLSEIPIFGATNIIVGAENSVFCYHQAIEFHHEFYSNQLAYKPNPGQGYGRIIL